MKSDSKPGMILRPPVVVWIAFVGLQMVGCKWSSSTPPRIDPNKSNVQSFQQNSKVYAQGRLLPSNGIIQLSVPPGDRIEKILVKQGEDVAKSQPLLLLSSESLRQSELQVAQQKLVETRSQLSTKIQEADLLIRSAEANLNRAKAALVQTEASLELVENSKSQLEQSRKQLARMARLSEDPKTGPIVGSLEVDQKRLELAQRELSWNQSELTAKQAVQSAELSVQAATDQLQTAVESRKLVEAAFPLRSLELQIQNLESQLEKSRLLSPASATVLAINADEGEATSGMPIMDIADLSSMICQAEVHEADVARIALGDSVEIQSSAFPKILHGKVIRIDRVVGTPQMRMPNPMAKTDFRAVPVIIAIDEADSTQASRLVQLQVDVSITVASTASL